MRNLQIGVIVFLLTIAYPAHRGVAFAQAGNNCDLTAEQMIQQAKDDFILCYGGGGSGFYNAAFCYSGYSAKVYGAEITRAFCKMTGRIIP